MDESIELSGLFLHAQKPALLRFFLLCQRADCNLEGTLRGDVVLFLLPSSQIVYLPGPHHLELSRGPGGKQMTLSSTCHPSSRSGPCVSNLDPNSACLHASLIWRWPENTRGGAVTSTCALYSVSAEKHMSRRCCRLGRRAAPFSPVHAVDTSVKSRRDRLVPREPLFS